MLAISVYTTVTSAIGWAVAVAGIWECWPGRAMTVNIAFAAMTGMIAAMCWLDRHREKRDESRTLLIRTLADAVPAQPRAEVRHLSRAL